MEKVINPKEFKIKEKGPEEDIRIFNLNEIEKDKYVYLTICPTYDKKQEILGFIYVLAIMQDIDKEPTTLTESFITGIPPVLPKKVVYSKFHDKENKDNCGEFIKVIDEEDHEVTFEILEGLNIQPLDIEGIQKYFNLRSNYELQELETTLEKEETHEEKKNEDSSLKSTSSSEIPKNKTEKEDSKPEVEDKVQNETNTEVQPEPEKVLEPEIVK